MFKGWQRPKQQQQPKAPPIMQRSMEGLLDVDGWKCNCNPRLPMVLGITKGEGFNKGLKFYKCSNPDTGCNFFLWDTQARMRENGVSPSKSSSSKSPYKAPALPPTPTTTTRRHTRSNPDPLFSPTGIQSSPTKRHISDEYDQSGSDIERDMRWREPAGRSHSPAPPRKEHRTSTRASLPKFQNPPAQTPRFHWRQKAATGTRTSPRFKLPAYEPKTPTTVPISRFFTSATSTVTTPSSDDNIFTTPPVNPTRHSIFAPRPSTPPPPAYVPPTPVTPKSQPHQRNIGSPGRGLQDTLINDTFALLAKNGVSLKSAGRDLRTLLVRHVRQKEGISQGREVARQALISKKRENTELKRRVWELEEENKRMNEDREKMEEEVAELTHELERVKLSQSQSQKYLVGAKFGDPDPVSCRHGHEYMQ